MTLQKIEAGSVKLVLQGSQEGLEKILTLYREGKLTKILGIPVEDVQVVASQEERIPTAQPPNLIRLRRVSLQDDSLRVLVVDDHELTRLTLQLAFSAQENIQVVGLASNGQEAIEMVKRHHPNVIVLDLQMPVMDGKSIFTEIKAIAPNTQIIAYSSVEDTKSQEARANIDAFCKKDVPTNELIALVRELGQRASSLQSDKLG